MKKGINIGDFRNQNVTYEEAFEIAKDAGFDGVELTVGEDENTRLNLNTSDEEIEKIAENAKKIGIELHSVMAATFFKYSLSSEDEHSREMAKKVIKKEIDVARIFGADSILCVPGMVDAAIAGRNEVIRYDIAYDNCVKGMEELLPYAEENKVALAIENVANKFLLSPLEMREFIDCFKSDYVGAYLDVGNVTRIGFPEHWIEILGKRIKRLHFKDARDGVSGSLGLLSGIVNYPKVMECLKDIGYDGWVTSEISPFMYYPKQQIYYTSKSMDVILGK